MQGKLKDVLPIIIRKHSITELTLFEICPPNDANFCRVVFTGSLEQFDKEPEYESMRRYKRQRLNNKVYAFTTYHEKAFIFLSPESYILLGADLSEQLDNNPPEFLKKELHLPADQTDGEEGKR